jgi:endonuclease/exonuclease/phosphatase family metal-dependent hydrolase
MRVLFAFALCLLTLLPAARAQQVGDRVLLVERALGIPGHPAPGNNAISHRFPGNTTVTVTEIDSATGWLEVDDGAGNTAWIVRTYIASIAPSAPPPAGVCHVVASWNLEHFKTGANRGFPENTHGGPTYPSRTPAELAAIATAIRDTLRIRILVLNEINGEERETEAGTESRSVELDGLVAHLGPPFDYIIARSGSGQRVALLWDKRFAQMEAATEITVPRTVVDGADIFARDPLLGRFRLLHEGAAHNDLIVIGLHLASGQHRTQNHDAAMALLRRRIEELRAEGTVIPPGEHDILIAGDLNASWFDAKKERFFDEMNEGRWGVLAGPGYAGTRLAGVPLAPKSIIDYIIVTRLFGNERGLLGEEISDARARVHHEIADGDWAAFRKRFSDHFPVSTCVRITADND